MEIGVIGLGAMGRNLALQLVERGHRAITCDLWPEARAGAEAAGLEVAAEPLALLEALAPPRILLMMVKAGRPVNDLIDALSPGLRAGDLLIDGGNAHYRDTERRRDLLAARRIGFLGVGISGGAEGARHGAAIMAGGAEDDWRRAAPLLESVAARFEGSPCIARFGPGGAGHFVKMVHNGIEYALMQAIAEASDLLRLANGLTPAAAAAIFADWNRGPLGGFLVEITADLLARNDPETGRPLVDVVDDVAGQKGTGGWTVEAALSYGVPVPGIMAAVAQRQLSGQAEDRAAALALASEAGAGDATTGAFDTDDLAAALTGSVLATLAQGHGLLVRASEAEGWDLPIGEAYRVWRAGSILRMKLLAPFVEEIGTGPAPASALALPAVRERLAGALPGWRRAVVGAVAAGVPVPVLSAGLAAIESLSRRHLATALIQVQRDLFGAHGFRRVDRDGSHHLP